MSNDSSEVVVKVGRWDEEVGKRGIGGEWRERKEKEEKVTTQNGCEKRKAREREKGKGEPRHTTRSCPPVFAFGKGIDASTCLIEPALARGSSCCVLATIRAFCPT